MTDLSPPAPDSATLHEVERRLAHWLKVEQGQDEQTLAAAEAAFLVDYPEYAATTAIDELRAREYGRLDRLGHVYLDYTGGSLYAEAQLREHLELLAANVYGNPHSENPTSQAMTQLVEQARAAVLAFFNAAPDEYAVVFTANASGALKLVGEAYPFAPGGQFLLTFDNHNSVNGIREFARARGASTSYVPVLPPDLRLDAARLAALLDAGSDRPRLFAYPAQSNFSGVQHSLDWVAYAQARGWDVLLDAAAFAPSNRLDLGRWRPEFVTLSFYKIFGYPTGIGALIARRSALRKLARPWFAGGTITLASVQGDGHYLADGEAGFEDGTVNYLNIPAVEIGLRHLSAAGVDAVHTRVACLTGWLLDDLTALRHANGAPLVTIFGPIDTAARGGTVTMNFYDPDGALLDFHAIERQANAAQISLRTGCFCNPGAGELAHGLTRDAMAHCFHNEERMTFEQFISAMAADGKHAGAIRVSVGVASNFADVYRFSRFARRFLDRPEAAL